MISCIFENEKKASLRHVTVAAIAYNDQGQILLVKRSAKYTRPHAFTLPGGFLDRDETAAQAALRELREEAGHEGIIIGLFHVNDNPNRINEDRENVDFVFLVKAGNGKFQENDEITSIGWFDEKSLPSEDQFAFDHRKTILKFFEYQEKPFELPIIGAL